MHATTHIKVVHKTFEAILKARDNKKIEEDLRKRKLKLSFKNQDLKHSRKIVDSGTIKNLLSKIHYKGTQLA